MDSFSVDRKRDRYHGREAWHDTGHSDQAQFQFCDTDNLVAIFCTPAGNRSDVHLNERVDPRLHLPAARAHLILVVQQLQENSNALIEVLQADHPHDIRRIVAVRIWTFLVSDD